VLTGVDRWLRCGQSEPSSVAGSIFLVQGCALMQSAGDVYSMVGDQLVPKKLAHFYALAASS
jgi:hypothetical protein